MSEQQRPPEIIVSVAMITYNQEAYIAQAIDSVLMQRAGFPYELVIGEDCSTDGTRAIVEDYGRRYPDRVRLLLAERNTGDYGKANFVNTLAACRGRYVALLEGDDYWTDPDKLKKQADFLDATPECALCFHPALRVHQNGECPPEVSPEEPRGRYGLEDLLRHGNFIPTCTVMFRRGVSGPYPSWFFKSRMGDFPLHVMNARTGDIGCLHDGGPMAVYRLHGANSWGMQSPVFQLRGEIECLGHLADFLGGPHRRVIRKRLAYLHELLSWEYEKTGRFREARASVMETIRQWPNTVVRHPKATTQRLMRYTRLIRRGMKNRTEGRAE